MKILKNLEFMESSSVIALLNENKNTSIEVWKDPRVDPKYNEEFIDLLESIL